MQATWTATWTELTAFLQVWALPIALASGALMLISLLMIPYIVAKIPADYFAHDRRHSLRENLRHPAVEFVLVSIKNLLGGLLLVFGLILLPGPGPGIITIAFGLSMMNFPGKYRLERRVVGHPRVLKGINAMRRRHGQPPLTGLR